MRVDCQLFHQTLFFKINFAFLVKLPLHIEAFTIQQIHYAHTKKHPLYVYLFTHENYSRLYGRSLPSRPIFIGIFTQQSLIWMWTILPAGWMNVDVGEPIM